MAETQGKSIPDFLDGLRRRWWIVALCFLALAPVAATVAYIMPTVYAASARIIVESQQIPDELARSTVTATPNERVEFIRQLLTTRQNLIAIVQKHDLYGGFSDMTLSAKIERLRESTKIETFSTGSFNRREGRAAVVGFTIVVRAGQAATAATIANEFVTLALDLNLKQRTERASETVSFFAREVERLSGEIDGAETRLVAFKQRNAASLPEAAQFRRGELSNMERRETELVAQRKTLEDQRSDVEFLLERQRFGPAAAQLTPEEEQLRALKSTLIQQSGVLAPTHPQIRALEGRIAAIEKQISETASEGPDGAATDAVAFERERLQRQIVRLDEQIAAIDGRLAKMQGDMEEFRASLARAAEVEFELRRLEQRFADLQTQRAEAVRKRADAETGEKLELNRQAERFVVLEQAQAPQYPEPPGRTVVAGVGAGASLALGVAIVVLLELLNRAVMTPTDLERRVGLKPIIVVPYISTRREVRSRRLRAALIVLALGVGVPATLWYVDQNVIPLTVLWDRIMDRTGLRSLLQLIERRF